MYLYIICKIHHRARLSGEIVVWRMLWLSQEPKLPKTPKEIGDKPAKQLPKNIVAKARKRIGEANEQLMMLATLITHGLSEAGQEFCTPQLVEKARGSGNTVAAFRDKLDVMLQSNKGEDKDDANKAIAAISEQMDSVAEWNSKLEGTMEKPQTSHR